MMISKRLLLCLLTFVSISLYAQEANIIENNETTKVSILFELDSRRTIINRKSVGIYGARLGALINQKVEFGVGVYSSNLFGILGNSVNKNYTDNSLDPPAIFDSEIGFHYFSLFSEYRLINKERIVFTLNSQIGTGWVDISFVDVTPPKEDIRELKSLIEHSIKADIKTFSWLRLIGGVGYRYLIQGERQIKDAFNAPIYIIGFSVDLRLLKDTLFKKQVEK